MEGFYITVIQIFYILNCILNIYNSFSISSDAFWSRNEYWISPGQFRKCRNDILNIYKSILVIRNIILHILNAILDAINLIRFVISLIQISDIFNQFFIPRFLLMTSVFPFLITLMKRLIFTVQTSISYFWLHIRYS